MEELRRAFIKGYLTVNGYKSLNPILKVNFHRWADDVIYEDDKAFSRTIGIVEDSESGQVYNVLPKDITFEK